MKWRGSKLEGVEGRKEVGEGGVCDPDSEKCSSVINISLCWKG